MTHVLSKTPGINCSTSWRTKVPIPGLLQISKFLLTHPRDDKESVEDQVLHHRYKDLIGQNVRGIIEADFCPGNGPPHASFRQKDALDQISDVQLVETIDYDDEEDDSVWTPLRRTYCN